jgi:hypothetical protein
MKTLKSILTSIFILICSSNSFADQPKLGKYPTVYEGDDYVVTILKIGSKEEKTVLIKVDGIDNDFDGEIYLHGTICDNTDCSNYKYETTEIPGKEKWWTVQSTRSWGEYDNVILYPPGINKKTPISKVKRPKDFDSEKFYSEYLGQKARR